MDKTPKKILVNAITLEGANITPLLLKLKNWQSQGAKITFFGNAYLRERISSDGLLKDYDFILFKNRFIRQRDLKYVSSRFQFIGECLKRNIASLFYLKKIKNQYDIIYSISAVLDVVFFAYFLKLAGKKTKWAVVFDNTIALDNPSHKIVGFLAWLFFKISLRLMKKADIVFCVKPELRNFLLERRFHPQQLVVTGNGVEADLIENAKADSKYNIDALFVGRINEAKGIYDLLEVLERVKKKYPGFQLALMGDGDEQTKKKFKEKIKKMGLEGNVLFLGYLKGQEKFNAIKSSKIFLFLSKTESLPIAPLEAVCLGLPVLVYDLDAYDMYKNNEVIIFKKNDYQAVAEKMMEIFDKSDFENEKGKLLLGKYSWGKIAEIEYGTMNKF